MAFHCLHFHLNTSTVVIVCVSYSIHVKIQYNIQNSFEYNIYYMTHKHNAQDWPRRYDYVYCKLKYNISVSLSVCALATFATVIFVQIVTPTVIGDRAWERTVRQREDSLANILCVVKRRSVYSRRRKLSDQFNTNILITNIYILRVHSDCLLYRKGYLIQFLKTPLILDIYGKCKYYNRLLTLNLVRRRKRVKKKRKKKSWWLTQKLKAKKDCQHEFNWYL